MFANLIYWGSLIYQWYLFWLILGLICLPLGSLIFSRFIDKGYPFFKIISLSIIGFLIFLTGRFSILPFNNITIVIVTILFFLLNFFIKRKFNPKIPSFPIILAYEFFFLGSLILWCYIKGYEPSIKSLEKYMDFGFIQTILNSKYFPPQDIWYASTKDHFYAINYYYFGHFITALLIKITAIKAQIGYNLMLCSIFACGTTLSFSLGINLITLLTNNKVSKKISIITGIIAAYLVNFSGNLHTIYAFTKGYSVDKPVPFWQILTFFNPTKYWYPNATRFIPFTIHEFPAYSYAVSDLHGHVLDIPFVLTNLALFISLIVNTNPLVNKILLLLISFGLGINYMTNSTDFLVYGSLVFFILVIKYQTLKDVLIRLIGIICLGLVFTYPFSSSFIPFASKLGVNCALPFLIKLGKLGPFVFEADKCQASPFWMLLVLWGFFWLNFLFFLFLVFFKNKKDKQNFSLNINYYLFFTFVFSVLLTLFAEFFYFKDIYPAHYRANTMFKLGYQAFIIMSINSAVVFVYIFKYLSKSIAKVAYLLIFIPAFFLVTIYPFFSIPGYFGNKGFKTLDGASWIKESYPEISEIIVYLNQQTIKNKLPFSIVEAHGDSYTDYNLVSSHTGISTIVGWPIHEWLWRGSYDVVAPRAEEVRLIYEGEDKDLKKIKKILKKYHSKYILVTSLEKQKYPKLNWKKFYGLGHLVYKKKEQFLFKINDN